MGEYPTVHQDISMRTSDNRQGTVIFIQVLTILSVVAAKKIVIKATDRLLTGPIETGVEALTDTVFNGADAAGQLISDIVSIPFGGPNTADAVLAGTLDGEKFKPVKEKAKPPKKIQCASRRGFILLGALADKLHGDKDKEEEECGDYNPVYEETLVGLPYEPPVCHSVHETGFRTEFKTECGKVHSRVCQTSYRTVCDHAQTSECKVTYAKSCSTETQLQCSPTCSTQYTTICSPAYSNRRVDPIDRLDILTSPAQARGDIKPFTNLGTGATYSAPDASYGAPEPAYSAPDTSYGAPKPAYSAPGTTYSAPAQNCQEVPQQVCNDNCQPIPLENCVTKPEEVCDTVPIQDCRLVPQGTLCADVPEKQCRQKAILKPQTVTKTVCNRR